MQEDALFDRTYTLHPHMTVPYFRVGQNVLLESWL